MEKQKSDGEYGFQVLLVDDRPESIKHMKVMLEEIGGYTVLTVPADEAAGIISGKEPPDLILVDLGTSAVSGIDLIDRLKGAQDIIEVPIILVAGQENDPAELYSGLQSGALDFIRKPIDPFELAARLHAARRLRESIREIKQKSGELEKLNETLFLLNHSLEEKNRELYQSVITDGLTRIYNRSYLMETLSKEFSKSKRHGLAFSCVMIDIDHFKNINDSYGHLAGDYVLKTTAARIKEVVRHEDILGRYGGEEFLLILTNSMEENSRTVAEKIRDTVENTLYDYNGSTINLRLSLGVADNKTGLPPDVDQLILNADKALYQAKRNGRNQTVCFSSLYRSSPTPSA